MLLPWVQQVALEQAAKAAEVLEAGFPADIGEGRTGRGCLPPSSGRCIRIAGQEGGSEGGTPAHKVRFHHLRLVV